MFLLVIILTFLAAKLATRNTSKDDTEGLIEGEEDEFSENVDKIENEKAIFTIDEISKIGTNQNFCPEMLTRIR